LHANTGGDVGTEEATAADELQTEEGKTVRFDVFTHPDI